MAIVIICLYPILEKYIFCIKSQFCLMRSETEIEWFKVLWNLIHPCSYFVVSSLPPRSLLVRKNVNVCKTRRGCRHANLVRTVGVTKCDRRTPNTPLPPTPSTLPPPFEKSYSRLSLNNVMCPILFQKNLWISDLYFRVWRIWASRVPDLFSKPK